MLSATIHYFIATVESDAFALMMLFVIFFSLGMVALLIWMMRYKAKRRDHHVDALIDELSLNYDGKQQEKSPESTKGNKQAAEWEKNPDWWKSNLNQ